MLYETTGLTRKHGERTVLSIDSLEIEEGKIYTLIGPNGAGKTTLLKILSFLDKPTGGNLSFLGQKVNYSTNMLHSLRKRVVLLDQNPIMFSGTVYQNVEFGLKVRNIARSERPELIKKALDMVGMERFINHDAKRLSGGETKRVALARALVLKPDVLLCDEPTANVDIENQELILNIIQKANQEQKTSIIFSTHYLSQGSRLADHTLLLQYGRISDLSSENIFKVNVLQRTNGKVLCQFTGQLAIGLPVELFSENEKNVKIQIDPVKISYSYNGNTDLPDTSYPGHIKELSQSRGKVKAVVDIGVNLILYMEMDRYLQEKPVIGQKIMLGIPDEAVFRSDEPIK